MIVNRRKSKEMILGSLANSQYHVLLYSLMLSNVLLVSNYFVLLCRMTLSWEAHVNTICAKVAPRLYYLKQLRCTGISLNDLSYFYLMVIRPVLEYGCATWHHGLTVAQSQKLESLQKRALRIIHPIAYDMPYDSACVYTGVEPLSVRRCDLGRKFFSQLQTLTFVYMTFFPNDEAQILFLNSDDIPPIPNHERELTNIGLSSTLSWLNTNNFKI